MKKMSYDVLMTAKVRNVGLTLVMMLACVLLLYKVGLHSKQPNAPAVDLVTIAAIVVAIALIALTFSIGRFVESIDAEKFAIYTRIGWSKVGLKTFNKTAREYVMIEQDEDRYYCLTIKTREGDVVIIERYPTLDHATGPLRALKEIVT